MGTIPSLPEEDQNMADATEEKMLAVAVAPGVKLGLTVKTDRKLGGCTITAIHPDCTFKDKVEVGDNIATIDGKKVMKIPDLLVGNTKSRTFGVVKKRVHQTECQQQEPATKAPSQKPTTVATPAASNSKKNPVVTTEKLRGAATKNISRAKNNIEAGDKGGDFEVLLSCPNGSVINLCPRHNRWHVILGRGVHGIPSQSKVPYRACVIRIVEKSNDSGRELAKSKSGEKQYAIELVPMRDERCTVQRNGNDLFVTSITEAMSSVGLQSTHCPTSIIIRNGDIIHPYDLEKMSDNPGDLKFKVEIISGAGATEGGKESMELDGSAFAAATEKINKAAAVSNAAQARPSDANPCDLENNGKETAVQNPFDFDKDSLRRTFLARPNSTAKFFQAYCRVLSKKENSTNSNTKLSSSVINAFIDAMSPRDHYQDEQKILPSKPDSFPLRQILDILVDCEDAELGKRAIEGYVWLSCQKTARKPTGVDPPSGPILLITPHLPLRKICEKNGWENMESVLVHSMEMLCKYQISISRFATLIEAVQPDASSVSADSAQLRVFFRLAKLVYEKWFPIDPEGTARHFIEYNVKISRSSTVGDKLVNAFVDAMSPSDISNRRVPKSEVGYYFPLRRIIETILFGSIGSAHKELGKRVLEGYVWLSCQKPSYSRVRGPMIMKNIVSIVCNNIGWDLIGDVLVESVEKLCDLKELEEAFSLLEEVMKESSRAGNSQSSLVCVRLAKVTSKMFTHERFLSNPTATAKLFCSQYKHLEKDLSNKELRDDVLNSFVNAMSPREDSTRSTISRHLDAFPLKDILCLLVNGGHMKLGKRVLEGHVWLSSKNSSYDCGLELLESAGEPIVSLCDAIGWDKLETTLIKSSEKLCRLGKARVAIRVIIKIAPELSDRNSQRSRVCSEMAKIACDKAVIEIERRRRFDNPDEIPYYKKLIWVLVNFCPTLVQKFVAVGKQFDVDNVLYPLLTDTALRSSSSANAMKDILNQLTEHCAQELQSRVSSDPNMVTAWTISNAGSYSHTIFGEFLHSHCKQTFDYKVRKSDHKAFQEQLRRLVNSGEVTCKSHQPYNGCAYYFQVTKLKTSRVHLNNLSCACPFYDFNRKISLQPSGCLRDSSRKERAEAKAKLDTIKTFLAADSSLKRKAVDALGDDDDDEVVLTGVAGVAETVAKRVKAAEDAGEVIEIL